VPGVKVHRYVIGCVLFFQMFGQMTVKVIFIEVIPVHTYMASSVLDAMWRLYMQVNGLTLHSH
jgi:hypothetical protein